MWLAGLLLAGTVLGAFRSTAAETFDFRKGFAHVARQATPAVVFIQVEKKVEMGRGGQLFFNNPYDLFGEEFFERFFGPGFRRQQPPQGGERGRSFVQTGQGSGFIISKDGYILTNTHVVGDADRIRVRLQSGKEYTAKRIGADARTEVAVVKIDAGEELPAVRLGDVSKLEIGEWVVAIGNPFGLKETLTVGVVSAKGRAGIGITDYEDFIQTDAAINPGNSGGPLLNIDGEVVGINTAIFSRSGGYMGIGFAVPIDMAVGIKDQLVANGKVTRGYLGVLLNPGDLDPEMASSFGLKEGGGVLLADVLPDGPAAKAGLQAGDIVLELQGAPVAETRLFRQEVARLPPESKVELTVFREGKRRKVTVTVGTAPEEGLAEAGAPAGGNDDAAARKLGLALQPLTPDLAARFGYEQNAAGVLVAEVEPGSPAAREGMQPGDLVEGVNRTPVATPADFHKQAAAAKGPLLLQLRTPRGRRFVLLRAEE